MEKNTGKLRYNTKTSKILVSRNDLRLPWIDSQTYFEADFYKCKNGEYFICGKGGLLSIFRGIREDKILPLTKDEAGKLAKEFMKPDAYNDEFEDT